MTSPLEKKAAAVGYDPSSDGAPRIVAQGNGQMASRIENIARLQKIPVVVDPELSYILSMLPVGQEIPENLYRVVASLLGMVLKIKQDRNY